MILHNWVKSLLICAVLFPVASFVSAENSAFSEENLRVRDLETRYQLNTYFVKEDTDRMSFEDYRKGSQYLRGYGGKERDFKEAERWLLKSATKGWGYHEAFADLGLIYKLGGYGVEQDFEKSWDWYVKAAYHGNASAQFNLAWMLYTGEGVVEDDGNAAYWLNALTEQGDPFGLYTNGELWMYGGLDSKRSEWKDYVLAYAWFLSSINYVDRYGKVGSTQFVKEEIVGLATKAMRELDAKMTSSQIQEARKIASEHQPFRHFNPPPEYQ